MNDETESISAKTWNRNAKTLYKTGYMDGASDGQTAMFQESFDTGYNIGLNFGLQLGLNEAALSLKKNKMSGTKNLTDPRRINCQICINGKSQDKIDNLVNEQKEKNYDFIAMN